MGTRRSGGGLSGPGLFDSARHPSAASLEECREAAAHCTGCPLYARATQTVFGEGPLRAPLMLVGEQPGHEEDLAGRPFVGPAGRLLDQALQEAGLSRQRIYITNAVKHFKWKPGGEGGKRRIHETPNQAEVQACRPWFQQELELVQPRVLVCLGATAAAASLGRRVTISSTRGRRLEAFGRPTYVTVHPSAILRIPDRSAKEAERERFVGDLRAAGEAAEQLGN